MLLFFKEYWKMKHLMLKTGKMSAENSALPSQNKWYILKYRKQLLNFTNIAQRDCFTVFLIK